MSTNTPNVDVIRGQIKNLEGLLSEISGEALYIWDGQSGDLADTPDGPGFVLHVSWAVSDRSYAAWFREIEPAKARLLSIARKEGCLPSENGLSVDLTSPGCHSSRAWIESVNTEDPAAAFVGEVIAGAAPGPARRERLAGESSTRPVSGDQRIFDVRPDQGRAEFHVFDEPCGSLDLSVLGVYRPGSGPNDGGFPGHVPHFYVRFRSIKDGRGNVAWEGEVVTVEQATSEGWGPAK